MRLLENFYNITIRTPTSTSKCKRIFALLNNLLNVETERSDSHPYQPKRNY